MYRLLIVDDEHHITDSLSELFQYQDQIELEVYKAYLVEDAFNILDSVKIDIVLTDIRMPGIDGFGLADCITEKWPLSKIIFLTAHSDFEYAYKANKYDGAKYLLKTEDDEVIINTVIEAAEHIEADRKNILLMEQNVDMQELLYYHIRKDALGNMIDGMEMYSISDKTDNYGIELVSDKKTEVILIRIDTSCNSTISDEKFVIRLKKTLKCLMVSKAYCEIQQQRRNEYMLLIQTESDTEEEEKRMILFLSQMLDEFAASCLEQLGVYAFFIMMNHFIPWKEIREKYELLDIFAHEAAETKEVYGGRIITAEDEQEIKGQDDELIWQINFQKNITNMRYLLENHEEEGFLLELEPIEKAAHNIANKHCYPMIDIYQQIANMLLSYINRRKLLERISMKIGIYKLLSVYEFESWSDAFIYFRNVVKEIFSVSEEAQNDRNDRFVSFIMDYVKKHIGENLSLTEIAARINYNPSYVSRMFKQLSGRNLLEFIQSERMNYAAEKLRNTGEAIQNIAKEVGFDSARYFSTAFRKQFGMSPIDYRHQKTV